MNTKNVKKSSVAITNAYLKRVQSKHAYFQKLYEIQREVVGNLNRDEHSVKNMKEYIDNNQPKPIAKSTIDRFVNYGRGRGYKLYSRGPAAPTLFAILDANGYEVNIRYKKNK